MLLRFEFRLNEHVFERIYPCDIALRIIYSRVIFRRFAAASLSLLSLFFFFFFLRFLLASAANRSIY